MDDYDVSTIAMSMMMIVQKQQLATEQVSILRRKQGEVAQRLLKSCHLGTIYSQRLAASFLLESACWFSSYASLQSSLLRRISESVLREEPVSSNQALILAIEAGSGQLPGTTLGNLDLSDLSQESSQDASMPDEPRDVDHTVNQGGVFPLVDDHLCMRHFTGFSVVLGRRD